MTESEKAVEKANKWLALTVKKLGLKVNYSDSVKKLHPVSLTGKFPYYEVNISTDEFLIEFDEDRAWEEFSRKFDIESCKGQCLDISPVYDNQHFMKGDDQYPPADVLLACLYRSMKDGGCASSCGYCDRCKQAKILRGLLSPVETPAHHGVHFVAG